jgi:hypothetical protein
MDDNDGRDRPLTERQRRDAEIEARAATAYDDLFKAKDKNDWAKWMYIADGLMLGRRWAMAKAGTQSPSGKGYNIAFSRWMATREWARDLDKPTRSDLFWCAERRSEIEEWRDELDAHERMKKNHPTHMKRAYTAAHKPPKDEAEDEASEDRAKKGAPDEEALRKELEQLRSIVVKLKDNPFSWWSGAVDEGARSMFEDRGDGRRADGKARELLLALATEFKAHFPNQAAQLLDELTLILRGPLDPAGIQAVIEATNAQARATRKAARVAARRPKGKKAVNKPKEAGA